MKKNNVGKGQLTPAQQFAMTHPSLMQIVNSTKYISLLEDQEKLKNDDE